jgi:hypothetical protein
MSECKSTQKAGPSEGTDLSAISTILQMILAVFAIPKEPAATLPPPLLLAGAKLRPGLSARDIAARIISRQSEAGAPVGDIFSKSNSIAEAMERIRMEEIVNALVTEAKVSITIAPGIQVATVGTGYMGFQVISQGATTALASGDGAVS